VNDGVAQRLTDYHRLIPKWFGWLRTQLYPPKQHGGDNDGRAEVSGQFVIAGCDPAPVLEAREGPFDDVASFVGRLVERMEVFTPGVVFDDRWFPVRSGTHRTHCCRKQHRRTAPSPATVVRSIRRRGDGRSRKRWLSGRGSSRLTQMAWRTRWSGYTLWASGIPPLGR